MERELLKKKEILLVDDKLLHHHWIEQTGLRPVLPNARIIHAFSRHDAVRKIEERQKGLRNKIAELKASLPGKPAEQQEAMREKMARYAEQVHKPFDAIISDLNMETQKAGIRLIEDVRLKKLRVPFLLVSATNQLEELRREAEKAGADEVHFKHEVANPETVRAIMLRMFAKYAPHK